MLFVLILLGSLIAATGTIPYVWLTLKGKVKPRLVTWLTWAMLTAVAGLASLSDGQVGSAIFALIGTLATASVVVVGFKYGDRSFNKLDVFCGVTVLLGLGLWLLLDSPETAVWVAIIVDFVGLVPTFRHAWQKPQEENALTFWAVAVGGTLTSVAVVAGGNFSVTALAYPLYAAISTGVCAALIQILQHRTASTKPASGQS